MANLLFIGIAFAAYAIYSVYRYATRRGMGQLRGPASPSFLFGHAIEWSHQEEVGDLDRQFIREYGTAWRGKDCLGKDILMLADPKALQHVYHKSAYNYPRKVDARYVMRQLAGEGILFVEGQDHVRQRKIMNPAFAAGQLRTFLPLFRSKAAKLSQKWRDLLQAATSESEQVINVHPWLGRATLDAIGEAAFDYQCGALDDGDNELMLVYRNMFADSLLHPTKATLLFRSLWRYIPHHILRLVDYIPTREYRRFRTSLAVINRVSRTLIEEKTEASLMGKENKKDIMSILVRANASEDPKTQLTKDEMISQMAAFLLAGHETTGSSLTWTLWELAKHPEIQDKIRHEIAAIRARIAARDGGDFEVTDLDAMHYTLAVMKESLRFHPITPTLVREAGRDDMIPLAFPVTSTTGEVVSEIPISKGDGITISVWGYNRLPQLWGDDAEEFNPERFLEMDKGRQTTLGVFANLMSFSGGVRACIGWRFAILEMQAILVELIENFEFALPADKPDVMRVPTGITTPMIRGKMHLGAQMPLKVTVIR